MATITIKYSEILFDLRNKNAEEVRFIQEPQARYLAEAGTDKLDEIKRCIEEAFAYATSLCVRFLSVGELADAENTELADEDLTLSLNISDRRGGGKGQMIADCIHSLIINLALAKFYSTINQVDLSVKREKLAATDVQQFHKLIYTKLPPVYPTIE